MEEGKMFGRFHCKLANLYARA